jgi:hypothetical protein
MVNTSVRGARGDEPSFEEAINSPQAKEWWEAIFEELNSLEHKAVYEEVDRLPPGRKAVKHKWVLLIKRDKEGRISKYKARLVAKGFSQIPGQDFTFTFAPTARWDSIRIILTIAAVKDWELRHIDVKTAFLNGELEEEIYMEKPSMLGKGYWRLRKGLYGLKQAGRQWYKCVNAMYEEIGFKRCETDWGIYIRSTTSSHSLLSMSVDDMLYASDTKIEADTVKNQVAANFEITNLFR